MKNAKSFIAYLLVAVFLLGSIAASAQAAKEPVSSIGEGRIIGAITSGM